VGLIGAGLGGDSRVGGGAVNGNRRENVEPTDEVERDALEELSQDRVGQLLIWNRLV
jgi:hypothetical protein